MINVSEKPPVPEHYQDTLGPFSLTELTESPNG